MDQINIADNWEKLSGKSDWKNDSGVTMLDPLDVNLNKWITLCGERVQAIYDSIHDDDRSSPKYGNPRHKSEEFFSKVGLETDQPRHLYRVHKYFYAKADIHPELIDGSTESQTTWIGYVSVATDDGKIVLGRRDILICWRGTTFLIDWSANLNYDLESATDIFGNREPINPRVHKGFLSLYKSAKDQVREAVTELINHYAKEDLSITVSGHSLGAALATLNAADIVANRFNELMGSNKVIVVTALVFASPKVGDEEFTTVFSKQSNLHLLHIRHQNDLVPTLPTMSDYQEMGTTLSIKGLYTTTLSIKGTDTWMSRITTFVMNLSQMIINFHSLKNYLPALKDKAAGRGSRIFGQDVVVEKREDDTFRIELSDTTT